MQRVWLKKLRYIRLEKSLRSNLQSHEWIGFTSLGFRRLKLLEAVLSLLKDVTVNVPSEQYFGSFPDKNPLGPRAQYNDWARSRTPTSFEILKSCELTPCQRFKPRAKGSLHINFFFQFSFILFFSLNTEFDIKFTLTRNWRSSSNCKS